MLYALQALYSKDFDTALEQVVFFFVPFALLFALLREVEWSREVVLACLGVLVALAVVFCAIGFWEYDRRELFWNPKVIAANQFESYFRVNSVFWDPNVYGRFLALVMTAVAAFLLWTRQPRDRARRRRGARRPVGRPRADVLAVELRRAAGGPRGAGGAAVGRAPHRAAPRSWPWRWRR